MFLNVDTMKALVACSRLPKKVSSPCSVHDLICVNFDANEIVATNGHILCRVECERTESDDNVSGIVVFKADDFENAYKIHKKDFRIEVTSNKIGGISVNPVECKYPDYERMIGFYSTRNENTAYENARFSMIDWRYMKIIQETESSLIGYEGFDWWLSPNLNSAMIAEKRLNDKLLQIVVMPRRYTIANQPKDELEKKAA